MRSTRGTRPGVATSSTPRQTSLRPPDKPLTLAAHPSESTDPVKFCGFLFCALVFRDLKEHENTLCPGSEEEDSGPGEECITRIRRVRRSCARPDVSKL